MTNLAMNDFKPETNIRSDDRVLVLEAVGGKPLNSKGLVDTRLFKGENKLHAMMDGQTCLWYLKQDHGILPEPLRQKFTSFRALRDFTEGYYGRRDVVIKEVID